MHQDAGESQICAFRNNLCTELFLHLIRHHDIEIIWAALQTVKPSSDVYGRIQQTGLTKWENDLK